MSRPDRNETWIVGQIDRARTPKPDRARPAIIRLDEAWRHALQEEGPGALFRWGCRRVQETWRAIGAERAAEAEAAFKGAGE